MKGEMGSLESNWEGNRERKEVGNRTGKRKHEWEAAIDEDESYGNGKREIGYVGDKIYPLKFPAPFQLLAPRKLSI